MFDVIFRVLLAVLACVGLVQIVSWICVHSAVRGRRIVRVFPVGGDAGKQMAAMYACLQWEANPSGQTFVLYDAGLTEQGVKDCEALARGAGVAFVRPGKLEEFLSAGPKAPFTGIS